MMPPADQVPGTKPGTRWAGVQPRLAQIVQNPDRRSIIGLPAKIASVGHPGQQCAGIPFSGSVTLIA